MYQCFRRGKRHKVSQVLFYLERIASLLKGTKMNSSQTVYFNLIFGHLSLKHSKDKRDKIDTKSFFDFKIIQYMYRSLVVENY